MDESKFDRDAYSSGQEGVATRRICERPRYQVGCGMCAPCKRALKRAATGMHPDAWAFAA